MRTRRATTSVCFYNDSETSRFAIPSTRPTRQPARPYQGSDLRTKVSQTQMPTRQIQIPRLVLTRWLADDWVLTDWERKYVDTRRTLQIIRLHITSPPHPAYRYPIYSAPPDTYTLPFYIAPPLLPRTPSPSSSLSHTCTRCLLPPSLIAFPASHLTFPPPPSRFPRPVLPPLTPPRTRTLPTSFPVPPTSVHTHTYYTTN
ncbi:hypothetical protein DFH06DRAFT_1159358 [Mycena polygramma]|nr:hypothetical protein DFH06DRAFT_1159358 [Mycena polygramma]